MQPFHRALRGAISLATSSLAAAVLLAAPAQAATVFASFDATPGANREVISLAVNPLTGNLFLHTAFSSVIEERLPDGTLVGTFDAPGRDTDDHGMDFVPDGAGGVSLAVFNGDDSPETLTILDPVTGNVLSGGVLPSGSLVGGTFNPVTGTFFTVDFEGQDLVTEIDPATFAQLNSFPVNTPGFDVFYGGVETVEATGNLLLVSDSQQTLRELTIAGILVRDTDLSPFVGNCGMAAISHDTGTGNLWVGCTDGQVIGIEGLEFGAVPLPAGGWLMLGGLGAVLAMLRRPAALRRPV